MKLSKMQFQFVMYNFIGLIAGILNIALLYYLTEFGGIYYIYSAIISLFLVNALKFFMNKSWTFKEKLKRHCWKEFVKFMLVGLLTIIMNIIVLYILTDFIGIYYIISQLIAIMFNGIVGFYLNETWTFDH
jgi:dolichol-phosphate mannosyltransferase